MGQHCAHAHGGEHWTEFRANRPPLFALHGDEVGGQRIVPLVVDGGKGVKVSHQDVVRRVHVGDEDVGRGAKVVAQQLVAAADQQVMAPQPLDRAELASDAVEVASGEFRGQVGNAAAGKVRVALDNVPAEEEDQGD